MKMKGMPMSHVTSSSNISYNHKDIINDMGTTRTYNSLTKKNNLYDQSEDSEKAIIMPDLDRNEMRNHSHSHSHRDYYKNDHNDKRTSGGKADRSPSPKRFRINDTMNDNSTKDNRKRSLTPMMIYDDSKNDKVI